MQLCRVLALGDEATAEEGDAGMACLQSLYDGWRNGGMFGELEDVYLDADDIAEEGVRYFVPTGVTLDEPDSVYIDFDGNTRQPRDLAMYEILTEAGVQTAKLYDRTEWVSLLDLAATDTAPLSKRGAMGLAACLALSGGFADIFGSQAGPGTLKLARDFTASLMGKPGSTQPHDGAEYY